MIEQIGQYRIVRQLGEGGMGAVFEGVHVGSGRRVAVKTLLPHLSQQADVVGRFFNEARAISSIDHPNIVRVFDFGQLSDGSAFMVMEFLAGESLQDRLKRAHAALRPLVPAIAREIACALVAAHARGIMHRDLKPDNVMLVPDPSGNAVEQVKVLDFGIAKIAQDGELAAGMRAVKTKTGSVLGTPAYMSPEQCRGAGGITDKTDVYSLGAMIFHLFAGRPPFQGGLGEVLIMHIMDPPPNLRELAPGVPEEAVALVEAMMAKPPEARPTMREVVEHLDALVMPSLRAGLPTIVSEPPMGAAPSTLSLGAGEARAMATEPPRRTGLVALGALAVVALVTVAGWRLARHPDAPVQPHTPEVAAAVHAPVAIASAVPAPHHKVVWLVKSEPSEADVVRVSDGALLGKTPWYAEKEPGAGTLPVLVRRAGFVDQPATLDLAQDSMVHVKLERTHRGRTRRNDDLEIVPLH